MMRKKKNTDPFSRKREVGRFNILYEEQRKPHDITYRHVVVRAYKLCVLAREMLGVFLLELFNTTGCINKFLFTGEKRMTG